MKKAIAYTWLITFVGCALGIISYGCYIHRELLVLIGMVVGVPTLLYSLIWSFDIITGYKR